VQQAQDQLGVPMPPMRPALQDKQAVGGDLTRVLRKPLGINEGLLLRAWVDARYYTLLVVLAIVIGCLAALSMTLTLLFTLGSDAFYRALGFGMSFGCFIFLVDILILLPEPGRRNERNPGRVAKPLFRAILALVLGVLVAEPLVATLFRQDVNHAYREQAERIAISANTEYEKARDKEAERLAAIRNAASTDEADALATALEVEKTASAALQDQVAACRMETGSGSLSGRGKGRGPVAAALCDDIEDLSTAADKATTARETAETNLNTAKNNATNKYDSQITAWEDKNKPERVNDDPDSMGIWDRIAATNALLGEWHLAVAAVLVLLDLMPVITKITKGVTNYEEEMWWQQYTQTLIRDHDNEQVMQALVAGADARVELVKDAARETAESDARIARARRELEEAQILADLERQKMAIAARRVPSDQNAQDQIGRNGAGGARVDEATDLKSKELKPYHAGQKLTVEGVEFELVKKIGSGGFGEVWNVKAGKGCDAAEKQERLVVKLPLAEENASVETINARHIAMANEAQMYRRFRALRHLPQVFRVDASAIVMRYYPRSTLAVWLETARHEVQYRDLIRWLDDIAQALSTLWQQDFVHGDGKMGNLLVTDGDSSNVGLRDEPNRLRVADLGNCVSRGSPPTVGTPGNAPLEVLQRQPIYGTADVFSFLGCTAYQILTGRAPYASYGDPSVQAEAMALPPQSIRSINPSVPDEVEAIVLRWLAMNPLDRIHHSVHRLDDISSGMLINGIASDLRDINAAVKLDQFVFLGAPVHVNAEQPPTK
jgi:hypothetical protein